MPVWLQGCLGFLELVDVSFRGLLVRLDVNQLDLVLAAVAEQVYPSLQMVPEDSELEPRAWSHLSSRIAVESWNRLQALGSHNKFFERLLKYLSHSQCSL